MTRRLRVFFADRAVASQLKELLNQERVLKALEEKTGVPEGEPWRSRIAVAR